MPSKLSLPRPGPWNFVWVKKVFELSEVELTEFHCMPKESSGPWFSRCVITEMAFCITASNMESNIMWWIFLHYSILRSKFNESFLKNMLSRELNRWQGLRSSMVKYPLTRALRVLQELPFLVDSQIAMHGFLCRLQMTELSVRAFVTGMSHHNNVKARGKSLLRPSNNPGLRVSHLKLG